MPRCFKPAWSPATTPAASPPGNSTGSSRPASGWTCPTPGSRELWTEIFDPLDDMEEVAAHLARRYPLYLLSNTNPLHFRYIETHFAGLLKHFRAFILSYREGSRKPEAGIFQALIRQVGLPPAQILFIDDKEDFVVAARSHGLVAWPFVSPGDFQEQLSR